MFGKCNVEIHQNLENAITEAGLAAALKHNDILILDSFIDDLYDAAKKLETLVGIHQKENGKFYVVSNKGRKFADTLDDSTDPPIVIVDAWLNHSKI